MLDTIEILSGPARVQGFATAYSEGERADKPMLGLEMIRSYLLLSPEGDVAGIVTFFHIVHPHY